MPLRSSGRFCIRVSALLATALMGVGMVGIGKASAQSASPCGLPSASAKLQPTFAQALQWRHCLQGMQSQTDNSRASLAPWMDSLRALLPPAPGYWQPQILAYAREGRRGQQAPSLAQTDLALPWLLQDLPDVGASIWIQAAEVLLQRGDTAVGSLFLLRAVASDSTHLNLAKFRLANGMRQISEDAGQAQTQPSIKHADLYLTPATWHTASSWQALEFAFWEAGAARPALVCLERRIQASKTQLHSGQASEMWLAAAGRLQSMGLPRLAAKALDSARQSTNHSANPSALRALSIALNLSQTLGYPPIAAEWASRLIKPLDKPLALTLVTPELRLAAAKAALSDGRLDAASTWIGSDLPAGSDAFERAQLIQASLLSARGKHAESASLLRRLKASPQRRIDNGEVLHAQGLAALYAANWALADSLLTAASAYADAPETQLTLELRQALLLDTVNLVHWIRGLATSPFGMAQKREALERIPANSPLYAHSRLTLARYALAEGRPEESQKALKTLPKLAKAKALLAHWQEENDPDSAIVEFENLLVEFQQGVPAEFARERLRALGK
jgi:hypothetical protein